MSDHPADRHSDDLDGMIPDSVARDLRDLGEIARAGLDVPASFDDAVLNRARAHFAGSAGGARPNWITPVPLRRWVAIAASLLLLAGVGTLFVLRNGPRTHDLKPESGDRAEMAGDINRDARIDILDAFVLARTIDGWRRDDASPRGGTGGTPNRYLEAWDVTADGRIDAADVEWIAARAVVLDRSVAILGHSRAGGHPEGAHAVTGSVDSRLRGNDGELTSLSHALTLAMFTTIASHQDAESRPDAPANDPGPASPRFETVHIMLDSRDIPLAAWQVEFAAPPGSGVVIVGIEGGGHDAFVDAPYYDPEAMRHERAIVADFSLDDAATLPSGRVRVATIHVMIDAPGAPGDGDAAIEPRYDVKVMAAADVHGTAIDGAAVTLETHRNDDDSLEEDSHE